MPIKRSKLWILLGLFMIQAALPLGWADDSAAKSGAQSKPAAESKKDTSSQKVYVPGGDVKPPKLVHYVEPEFSSSSKEAFVEGTVSISTVITSEGQATELQIVKGLNTEEDKTALEAVKKWQFKPGTKAGEPVSVKMTVEVMFHLL